MSQFEILIIFFILNLFLVVNFEKINFFQIIIDKATMDTFKNEFDLINNLNKLL